MESGKENPVSHSRKEDAGFLRDRAKHLEDINRFTLDALDMITGLEDSHPSITRLPSPLPIVADMLRRGWTS